MSATGFQTQSINEITHIWHTDTDPFTIVTPLTYNGANYLLLYANQDPQRVQLRSARLALQSSGTFTPEWLGCTRWNGARDTAPASVAAITQFADWPALLIETAGQPGAWIATLGLRAGMWGQELLLTTVPLPAEPGWTAIAPLVIDGRPICALYYADREGGMLQLIDATGAVIARTGGLGEQWRTLISFGARPFLLLYDPDSGRLLLGDASPGAPLTWRPAALPREALGWKPTGWRKLTPLQGCTMTSASRTIDLCVLAYDNRDGFSEPRFFGIDPSAPGVAGITASVAAWTGARSIAPFLISGDLQREYFLWHRSWVGWQSEIGGTIVGVDASTHPLFDETPPVSAVVCSLSDTCEPDAGPRPLYDQTPPVLSACSE